MVRSALGFRLALRLLRSRNKGALTRFISFASTCGIAIGVFAAIVGFSAMNGFEHELQNRVLSIIPSAQLNSSAPNFFNEDKIQAQLLESPKIVATARAIEVKAIVSANRAFAPLMLVGIDPIEEQEVISIQRFVSTDLRCLNPKQFLQEDIRQELKDKCTLPFEKQDEVNLIKDAGLEGVDKTQVKEFAHAYKENLLNLPRIIIGSGLARKLQVNVGDEVFVVTLDGNSNKLHEQEDRSSAIFGSPQELNNNLRAPNRTRAIVQGLVHVGGQIDSTIAMMDFEVLKDISGLSGANTIHIRTKDFQNTHQDVFLASTNKIDESAYLVTWMSTQGKLYHDIQMVRQIMFVSMFLVLAVACFNIVSNLLMMVGEKRRDIAILLTMGMSPRLIVFTFACMGLLSGAFGTSIGLILGIIVSVSLSPITSSFKDWFGFDLLNEDVYFINFIPCRLEIVDVIIVLLSALVMSLLAALYPALRASRVKPALELNQ